MRENEIEFCVVEKIATSNQANILRIYFWNIEMKKDGN